MSKSKEYSFYVYLCGGRRADGIITVEGESESDAYGKAIDYVGRNLYKALPELGIDYEVELIEEEANI